MGYGDYKELVINGLRETVEDLKAWEFVTDPADKGQLVAMRNWVQAAVDELEAHLPHIVREEDFVNADKYGYITVWTETNDGDLYVECITKTAFEYSQNPNCEYRYWVGKPSKKLMEEISWMT